MKRQRLSSAAAEELLADLNAGLAEPWAVEDGKLSKEYRFRDFSQAFGFMTRAAMVAEQLDHHPDWRNVSHSVRVTLSTHDAGGLTALDFEFAKRLEAILQ